MEDVKKCRRQESGRFENDRQSQTVRHKILKHCLTVVLLLTWDGLLLYMIVKCLIEPVYGATFVAVVSVYLGNKL